MILGKRRTLATRRGTAVDSEGRAFLRCLKIRYLMFGCVIISGHLWLSEVIEIQVQVVEIYFCHSISIGRFVVVRLVEVVVARHRRRIIGPEYRRNR